MFSDFFFPPCVHTETPRQIPKNLRSDGPEVANLLIFLYIENKIIYTVRDHMCWTGKVLNQTFQIDINIFVTPEFLRLTCNILDTKRDRQTKRNTIEWSHIASPDCFLWPSWHAKSWTKWSGACSDVAIRYIWTPLDVILGYMGAQTKCWDEDLKGRNGHTVPKPELLKLRSAKHRLKAMV